MAINHDWISKGSMEKFKIKFNSVEGDILKVGLITLKNASFERETYQINKDIFTFSCYTGLAHIDVYNLTPDGLCTGIDGQNGFIPRGKNPVYPVKVPLLKRSG